MNTLHTASIPLAKQWLANLGISHYTCDHCSALHLSGLPGMEEALESRLFVEEWGLLLSTEFQIRPTALLSLVAEMSQLNGNYPTMKLFVDIVDDAVPQLVAGSTLLTGAGISEGQFALFTSTAVEMLAELHGELQQMECLITPESPTGENGGHSLH
ncbi:MAG: YbjN domain-containing protein [Porticoccaceae bacterium]|nr:YbjN domain-containing protein [Porticoccaceae bacterium]